LGPRTRSVQPRAGAIEPSGRAADSSARTAVVPTAITLPPVARVHVTSRAVAAGTRKRSGSGGSPRSWDETPVWSRTGATRIPRVTRLVTSSAVKGRPALGISALPGSFAKTVWYDAAGQRSLTYP
jgi:hypothetical protein